ncbi:MAG TPA: STAS domain-containing protein [Tissierellia bacterium]|jgi:SulP family sulfate permease|nr:STAS domain-containing protein [Tissierellia bacterium]
MKYKPVLFNWSKTFNKATLLTDITAGISVGIIAIPLSIALAIASGSTPEAGLWTSALAGFVAAFLAGCPQQITGPSATLVVISYSTISLYGYGGLLTAVFLAGIILVILGLLNLGKVIRYIPHPVVLGFTSGVAFVLTVGQLGDYLGLTLNNPPVQTAGRIIAYMEAIQSLNIYAFIIGTLSIIVIVVWNKYNKKIPGYLIALIVATIVSQGMALPVETIGTRFGNVSATLPSFVFPELELSKIKLLIFPAFTIAFISSLETLLSAVVADGVTGESHDPGMELISQGGANLVSALIGGLPCTGVIARTAANVKSGARTPLSGLVHSLVIMICNLVLMPFLSMVPMTALSAVLFIVSFNMVEWKGIKKMIRAPIADLLIMLITFILTVILDLSIAIISSVFLASMLFTVRMIRVSSIQEVREHEPLKEQKTIITYEIDGPLFFGFAHSIKELEKKLTNQAELVILDFNKVILIDATGLNALDKLVETGQNMAINFSFIKVKPHIKRIIEKAGISENIFVE